MFQYALMSPLKLCYVGVNLVSSDSLPSHSGRSLQEVTGVDKEVLAINCTRERVQYSFPLSESLSTDSVFVNKPQCNSYRNLHKYLLR